MRVSDILKTKGTDVVAVAPDDTVTAAVAVLSDKRIGAALVRDGDGGVVGVISERDIVRALARDGAAVLGQSVRALMSADVISCAPDDAVVDAMKVMTGRRIRHLPVVENDTVLGVISIGDVVKARIEDAESEAQALRDYVLAGR